MSKIEHELFGLSGSQMLCFYDSNDHLQHRVYDQILKQKYRFIISNTSFDEYIVVINQSFKY